MHISVVMDFRSQPEAFPCWGRGRRGGGQATAAIGSSWKGTTSKHHWSNHVPLIPSDWKHWNSCPVNMSIRQDTSEAKLASHIFQSGGVSYIPASGERVYWIRNKLCSGKARLDHSKREVKRDGWVLILIGTQSGTWGPRYIRGGERLISGRPNYDHPGKGRLHNASSTG